MKPLVPLLMRPCMVMALELRWLNESATAGKRLQGTLALVEQHLGGPHPHRLLIAGHRVFRIAPVEWNGSIPFWELLSIVHLQSELARRGVLLCGALTLGDAADRSSLATGPGLSEAERLCEEVALMPRVIVDPRLLRGVEDDEHLRGSHHTVPMELGYIRKLLREDSDGVWFVDYLKAFATEVDEPSLYLDFLEEHRQLVERQLKGADRLSRTSRSWTWLRSYHDRVIKELGLSDEEQARLRLSAQGPLVYAFPPSAKAPG